ncbi:lysozyme [Dyella sp. M7H15-1]|uniref:lysozyme n=1 Tax=Dyella sp. M7H15-1 TaxID=2501295 RepID=UPI00100525E5|nr:lysozyme [Dyella sp. M7H15-1]QAU22876.1 lysozyme [Dyella sp. M7H15-1]
MSTLTTSANGMALIKKFEGCRLTAYRCPVGIWTVGYGHTGPDVHEGTVITQADADRLLSERLRKEFEPGVSAAVTVPLEPDQFDALVSLAYNIGLGNLRSSTLLRKLNAGDYAGAAAQFDVWNKAGGSVLPGLVNRRSVERQLFELSL